MTKITTVTSGVVNKTTGNVHLFCVGEGSHPRPLEINRACAARMIFLVGSLLKASRELFKEKDEAQLITLTEARKFSDPNGNLHLLLTFEEGIDIGVALNENVVEGLQTLLAQLQKSGRLRKAPAVH
jgi:hypothetical protein